MMDSKQRAWETLRGEARQLDSDLEKQLTRLEQIANVNESNVSVSNSASRGGSGSNYEFNGATSGGDGTGSASPKTSLREVQHQFDTLRREIDGSLQRFDRVLVSMSDICRDLPASSPAAKHTERFQGLYQEKRQTLQRIELNFRQRRERLELMPSINKDLKQYHEDAGVRTLMDEQETIRHTQVRVNQILEQGASTHSRLLSQRERFNNIGDKLVQIVERVPMIQNVLHRIDVRRRREVVVLGAVVALCLLLTMVFL